MAKNFEKFIFLGVVIGIAFFARAAYPTTGASSKGQTAVITTQPPLLVLTSPSVPPSSGNTALQGFNNAAPGTSNNATESASITPTSAFVRKAGTPVPAVDAVATLVADPESGTIFSGTNIEKRWPTASITKLLTATVALDDIDPNANISITQAAFAADPEEANLVPGGTYAFADLMHALLMPSSNVAAEAIADYYGRAKFLSLMNARAAEWGMKDSYFDDPSGISSANESTAQDMMILARHVYENYPEILSYTRTSSYTITELTANRKATIKSINTFAGQSDFIGGKTGHTDEAGGNLLSLFRYDGHPVLVIVLGSSDRFGATAQLFGWFKENFQ